jgi:DNA-binding IclR family transcriptional regulator
MSVKIMGLVFDSELSPNHKLVLLAYADHAKHDGTSIFPAIASIARKTSYSRRQVQRVTQELVEAGYLVADGHGPRGTNKYRIPLEALPLYTTKRGGDKWRRRG